MSRPDPHPPVAVDLAISALQARVGDRVRAARREQSMSRRVLSERSGVSPRYLAQLESGEGNISIGLLMRVAAALDVPLVGLVDEAGPEAARIGAAYAAAPEVTRARVRAMVYGVPKAGRICLIGLRGAGKSTLGAAAAEILGLPFIELNSEIAAEGGMPVAEIMALYGPDGYRQLEADALARVEAEHERAIVAVAGGIVGEAGTFERLLARFHTIWLRASPDDHMARVRAQGDTRPMAGNPQAMVQLRMILSQREADYARADAQLNTSGASVDETLAALIRLIAERRYLAVEVGT